MTPVAVCRVCCVRSARGPAGRVAPRPRLPPAGRGGHDRQHAPHQTTACASSVKALTELLMADHPTPCAKHKATGDCELEAAGRQAGARRRPRVPKAANAGEHDDSSLVIAVDHNACILCDRCSPRLQRHPQQPGHRPDGQGLRGPDRLRPDDPMGDSSCVACGECMVSCPTGALINRNVRATPTPGRRRSPPAVAGRRPTSWSSHPLFETAFSGVAPFLQLERASRSSAGTSRRATSSAARASSARRPFSSSRASVEIFIRRRSSTSQKHVARQGGPGPLRPGPPVHQPSRQARRGPREEDEKHGTLHPHRRPGRAPLRQAQWPTMGVGDLFGEMTCMSYYPRSATVARRGGLHGAGDAPQRALHRAAQHSFRADPGRRTTASAPSTTTSGACRSSPACGRTRRSSSSSSTTCGRGCMLRRCEPGEMIFRQGDPADDGFYLVRTGFVKVSQNRPGGEHVLNYVGPGGYFGEIGLLSDLPEIRAMAPAGRPHRHLHGPGPRRPGPDHGGRLPRHPRPVPRPVARPAHRDAPSSAWKTTTGCAQRGREGLAGRLPRARG